MLTAFPKLVLNRSAHPDQKWSSELRKLDGASRWNGTVFAFGGSAKPGRVDGFASFLLEKKGGDPYEEQQPLLFISDQTGKTETENLRTCRPSEGSNFSGLYCNGLLETDVRSASGTA